MEDDSLRKVMEWCTDTNVRKLLDELKRYREREALVQELLKECSEWAWAMHADADRDISKAALSVRAFKLSASAAAAGVDESA